MKPMHREHASLPPVFVCAIKFIFEITHSYQTWLDSYETWLNGYMTNTSRACTPAAGIPVCHDSIHISHAPLISDMTNSYETWLDLYKRWWIHWQLPPLPPIFLCAMTQFIWDMTRIIWDMNGFISNMAKSYETWPHSYETRIDPHDTNA